MISKYEKYVLRNSTDPDPSIDWGKPELGIIDLHHFLRVSGPIQEANSMVEFAWIVKDSAFGVTKQKGPHKHNCPEIFMFMGTNPADRNELGGEVEFWMGEGDETEKIKINKSAVIWVPGGLLHLPMFFKRVRKPILLMIVATDIGNAMPNITMYPPRGV